MIIIGLGNPGDGFANTRHNVGFLVVDELTKVLQATAWTEEFGVRWSRVDEHWLIEPWQFMNTSGLILKSFFQKKNIELDPSTALVVIHDDVDFPLGEVHEQYDRSAAGHNGVQSIIDAFGQKFSRIRIGIGDNRERRIPAEEYVLQKFSADEQAIIHQAVTLAVETLTKKLSKTK